MHIGFKKSHNLMRIRLSIILVLMDVLLRLMTPKSLVQISYQMSILMVVA